MMSMINYLIKVSSVTINQVFILFGPVLLLTLGIYYMSTLARGQSERLFGLKFWMYFTFIGTVIHETGHALFALLFGHKITEFKPFAPNATDRTLGSVRHSFSNKNLYHAIGHFFIGIGPIILGSIVIFFSAKHLIGDYSYAPLSDVAMNASTLSSFDNTWVFIKDVYSNALQIFAILFKTENFSTWEFYVFVYIVFAVGTHLKLSPPDIESARTGFVFLVGLIFAVNLLSVWAGDWLTDYAVRISQPLSLLYAIMIFVIILNVLLILFLAPFWLIKWSITR